MSSWLLLCHNFLSFFSPVVAGGVFMGFVWEQSMMIIIFFFLLIAYRHFAMPHLLLSTSHTLGAKLARCCLSYVITAYYLVGTVRLKDWKRFFFLTLTCLFYKTDATRLELPVIMALSVLYRLISSL